MRDGTAETVLILRRDRGQRKIIFLVLLTTSRISNHTRLIPSLLEAMANILWAACGLFVPRFPSEARNTWSLVVIYKVFMTRLW